MHWTSRIAALLLLAVTMGLSGTVHARPPEAFVAMMTNGASGDIQANRVTVATNNVSAIALNLDQRVP